MSDIYKKIENETVKRYSKRLEKTGYDAKTLGWGSKEQQDYRFLQVLKNLDLNGKSVLDIGCGFGDFKKFCDKNGVWLKNYTGVDVNPDLISIAKGQNPECDFLKGNILDDSFACPTSDIVVMLGVLNFNLKDDFDNFLYSKNFIKKAFQIANRALIVDFLSSSLDKNYPREDFVFYHSPPKVLEFALDLTNDIKLIHNYAPVPQKEFMLVMEKPQ